jgi:hypothetical protein
MHNIRSNFDKIMVVLKDILGDEINAKGNYPRRGTVPRFSHTGEYAAGIGGLAYMCY